MNVRPFNGRRTTCSCSTAVPRLAVSARRIGASAVTVTCSRTSPMASSKSIRAFSPVESRMPARRTGPNPDSWTSTRYSPGARLGAVYTPSPLDTTMRRRFVSTLVTVTVAPGAAAPP